MKPDKQTTLKALEPSRVASFVVDVRRPQFLHEGAQKLPTAESSLTALKETGEI